MNATLPLFAMIAAAVASPSLPDFAAARSARHQLMLAEASGPSPAGRDTAVLADGESSGQTPGARDSALSV